MFKCKSLLIMMIIINSSFKVCVPKCPRLINANHFDTILSANKTEYGSINDIIKQNGMKNIN